MKKKPAKKAIECISGNELFDRLKPELVRVHVPELGIYINCRIPSADIVYQMTVEASGDREKLNKLIFKSALVDLTEKQIEALEKDNHGLRYMCVFRAVVNNADLFMLALTEDEQKN